MFLFSYTLTFWNNLLKTYLITGIISIWQRNILSFCDKTVSKIQMKKYFHSDIIQHVLSIFEHVGLILILTKVWKDPELFVLKTGEHSVCVFSVYIFTGR